MSMHISKSGIHRCAHLLGTKTKNDANTYLSVRDTMFRKHKKIALLKWPLGFASSIPQQISDICFNNHFLPPHLLQIPALHFVTHVEAKAILGRPATNLGTKCITFIPSSCKMFYFWPISILNDDITCWDTGTAMCKAHTVIALKYKLWKALPTTWIIVSSISYIFFLTC